MYLNPGRADALPTEQNVCLPIGMPKTNSRAKTREKRNS